MFITPSPLSDSSAFGASLPRSTPRAITVLPTLRPPNRTSPHRGRAVRTLRAGATQDVFVETQQHYRRIRDREPARRSAAPGRRAGGRPPAPRAPPAGRPAQRDDPRDVRLCRGNKENSHHAYLPESVRPRTPGTRLRQDFERAASETPTGVARSAGKLANRMMFRRKENGVRCAVESPSRMDLSTALEPFIHAARQHRDPRPRRRR